MQKNVEYKVMGKSVKATAIVEALMEYVAVEYTKKGKRIGIDTFVKRFGEFNDDKGTLKAVSVPSVKDIQTACRLVSEEVRDVSDAIPCVVSRNGVITVEARPVVEFDTYYPVVKVVVKKEVTPTEFAINYINKHIEAGDIDWESVKSAIDNA